MEKGDGVPRIAFGRCIDRDLARISSFPETSVWSQAPDGTIRLFPGLVRIPDVAFASWDRFPGSQDSRRSRSRPWLPTSSSRCLSESNTPAEMERKRGEYFASGVRLVWEVDPEARTVDVYTPDGAVTCSTPRRRSTAATSCLDSPWSSSELFCGTGPARLIDRAIVVVDPNFIKEHPNARPSSPPLPRPATVPAAQPSRVPQGRRLRVRSARPGRSAGARGAGRLADGPAGSAGRAISRPRPSAASSCS